MSYKVLNGWRVMAYTGHRIHPDDRWEVYGPNGGGVVNAGDVRDWVVRGLLDALAEQVEAGVAQSAPDEVFAIPVRENGKRTTIYTEVLPFAPGPGVEVLGEPVRMVAAQSAPAGEREAFEAATSTIDPSEVERLDGIREGWEAYAAWQRAQAAVVPEGWQIAPTNDGDGFSISSPRVNGIASHTAVFPDDNDPAHKLLWHMLAAAPAQPEVQGEDDLLLELEGLRESLETARHNWRAFEDRCGDLQVENGKLRDRIAASSAQPEVQRLREALDQLANGSHLDAARNHDDDSLREIAGCCTCGQHNRLLKHAGRVDAALAASTGQEV